MKTRSWHLITGEYPPQSGGVSDYSEHVAAALARGGDEVHVWAPPCDARGAPHDGVHVHRLGSRFGAGSLREMSAGIAACPPPRRLFVQYVATAFGYHAMNLPFCAWLSARRADTLWVMFHEFAFPIGWNRNPIRNAVAMVTCVMGSMVAARADRIFVSTPAWEKRIPSLARRSTPVTWLPVPSNLPVHPEAGLVQEARRRIAGDNAATVIGHFGTYSPIMSDLLTSILPDLLRGGQDRILLLLGRGGDQYAASVTARLPDLASRIVATGGLPSHLLAAHIRACDIMVQPYPDGVTCRRSSLMAGLALGLPIVTNDGPLVEPIWREERAVQLARDASPEAILQAVDELLGSKALQSELAGAAASLYARRFCLEGLIGTLRRLAGEEEGEPRGVAPVEGHSGRSL